MRAVPYQVPAAAPRAAHGLGAALLLAVLALAYLRAADLGMAVCGAVTCGAWVIFHGARLLLLRASAFEIWHAGSLLYSGIDRWQPPAGVALDDIFEELEKRGVKVTRPSKARGGCSGGG